MEKFGKGQPTLRVEDVRLLTGAGRYIDDIAPKDALHACFLRSSTWPMARSAASTPPPPPRRRAWSAVLTVADLEAMGMKVGIAAPVQKNRDGSKGASAAAADAGQGPGALCRRGGRRGRWPRPWPRPATPPN